ncbi:hypothetical protein PENTCL1PPCAC_23041, partial [Pristionchus entomophagus]
LLILLLLHLPSILGIACFTDIACIKLSNGEFACNNTGMVDCTESQACLSYYSAPDLTHSSSSWSSSTWSPRLRGCASDDVVTSLFDTATGWSARCGFGGDRLVKEKMAALRDSANQTETATIPILTNNDQNVETSPFTFNYTLTSDNSTFPFPPLLTTYLNDTVTPLNDLIQTTMQDNSTVYTNTRNGTILSNETIYNITTITTMSSSLSTISQSSTSSTTTDPDATTETTESSTTSETDPGEAIVTESSRRLR